MNQCIHKLFEAQVELTPDAEAIFFEGKRLTYQELNRRVNQLAHHLHSLGVGPETRVGVCLEPAWEAIVGLLGIWKAGGVWVPLDPMCSKERLSLKLKEIGAATLVTLERLKPSLTTPAKIVCLDSDWPIIAQANGENPACSGTGEELAYITFSLGRGIMIEQRSISNHLAWLQDEFGISSSDTVLHRTPLTLDTSIWEILWPLALGGRLIIAPTKGQNNLQYLRRLIAEQNISIAHFAPSELASFARSSDGSSPLRLVLCGGEPLHQAAVDAFFKHFTCKLYHVYCPPEAATKVTAQTCHPGQERMIVPVGQPISDLSVYVLDGRKQLVPIGVTGEVYIGGEYLARGYLNDPEETRQRFTENPFAEAAGERLFRTGDLGRWSSDGALELVGCAARQVWIQGHRVDLGEVEAALLQDPSVDECRVLVKDAETFERALVAYIVPTGPFSPERLQANTETVLPPIMRPQGYIGLSSLPLTPKGKVDEQALMNMPVLDADTTQRWENCLQSIPQVEQVAVVVKPHTESDALLHLSDLLPGWQAILPSAGEDKEATSVHTATLQEQTSLKKLSINEGKPLQVEAGAPTTLPEALRQAATLATDKGIVYVQPDGTEIRQSYLELLEDAERILAGLRKLGIKPQDKVLFQLDRNQDFIPAFWGCLLGGFVPVPVSIAPTYGQVNSAINKLHNAWKMLDHPLVLTGQALASSVRSLSTLLNMEDFHVQVIDDLRSNEPDHAWHPAQPDDLAILLLTSGSTGLPKAVMQKHGSILSRTVGTARLNGHSSHDISLNWMPIDHVGGIVMFHVRDVYLRSQQVHVPTHLILQNPLLWLDLIERYRATITWAPNFAYGLVNDRAEEIARRHWDLSALRFILNAGEAIVAKTARRFMELLQPHGLRATAMYPCWGMSETCSGVVYSQRFLLETTSDSDQFVQVGEPIPGFAARIVDAQNQVIEEGMRGHLQVKGLQVTCGYYQNPELNREVFTDDGWFKTGDLGIVQDGYLTIAGREKDIIIIRGINYYAHEIESVVEEVKGVQVSFTAACAVRSADSDTDKLAIFFSPSTPDTSLWVELVKQIRGKVVRDIGVNPEYLIPVPKEAIPKTEIGKIQRLPLRRRFEAGEFAANLKQIDLLMGNANTLPDWFYRRLWRPKEATNRPAKLRTDGCCLIFLDQAGLGAALRAKLNGSHRRCVCVEAGTEFARLEPDHFCINPHKPDHYQQLLDSLSQDGTQIDRIVHLWTYGEYTGEMPNLETLQLAQDKGVYNLLSLIQAVAQASSREPSVQLHVISSYAQAITPGDPVAYEKATLIGLLKTVALELSWLHCCHIDLEADEVEANVERVMRELDVPWSEPEIAYRGDSRLAPSLSKIDMLQQEMHPSPIKPGGVYLVSGGLGGIGAQLARFLIQTYQAKLIIVGRTVLPARVDWPAHLEQQTGAAKRIKNYLSIEETGGEFIYEPADVSQLTDVQKAITRAESQWNEPLSGIFHLAGEGNLESHWKAMDKHWTAVETRQWFEAMFQSKVYGTWTLYQLLQERPQAIFVSFSSVNALFGGATFSAYSAANSFLDAYSFHQQHHAHPQTYCINWTMWDDLGMSEGNPMYARDAARTMGYYVISKEQGLHSLLAGLCRNQAHLIVGLDASIQHIRRHVDAPSIALQELAGFFTAPANFQPPTQWQNLKVQDRFRTPTLCQWAQIAEMPLTPDRKIDRAALLGLEKRKVESSAALILPQTETERAIAAIWQELLHVDKVSTQDNFFDSGGDSLLLVQFHSKLQQTFNKELPVVEMFKYPTISALAEYLSQTADKPSLQESEKRAEARREAIRQRHGPQEKG